jgi:hypothetical protein
MYEDKQLKKKSSWMEFVECVAFALTTILNTVRYLLQGLLMLKITSFLPSVTH